MASDSTVLFEIGWPSSGAEDHRVMDRWATVMKRHDLSVAVEGCGLSLRYPERARAIPNSGQHFLLWETEVGGRL